MKPPRVLGIRHHSPACARLVARTIARERPQAVLIEGPSDFNARLGELMLDHDPPLAIYSHAHAADGKPAQCWYPLLSHSPEWIALRHGVVAGAQVRFIDLPHWTYRAMPDDTRRTAGQPRSRYGRVDAMLRERLRCDGPDALWDHLFEADEVNVNVNVDTDGDDSPTPFEQRLDAYFDELRGDDPGTAQDRAREALMSEWVRWATARFERVLVVCGGWHKPPIDQAWRAWRDQSAAGARGATEPPLESQSTDSQSTDSLSTDSLPPEPLAPVPPDPRQAGSYLVPFSDRQVDALGGYGAGLPSPLYYRWLWDHGAASAAERSMAVIVSRLRRKQVSCSTADVIAFEHHTRALAALRGRTTPLRTDLLDGLLSAVVKEALETPAPWHGDGLLRGDHHPILREALLALTGDGGGRLHGDTPQPPLLRDAERRLAEADLLIPFSSHTLVLDRRRAEDRPRSRLLWQLRVIGVGGVQLRSMAAPGGARSLAPALHFQEHWQLRRDDRWHADLIEASIHGATLDGAARQALAQRAGAQGGDPAALTGTLLAAVRAGLLDMGEDLAAQLRDGLPRCHDHGALAGAARTLAELARTGFWSDDPRAMLEATLGAIADRLTGLLEDRGLASDADASSSEGGSAGAASVPASSPAQAEADVRAVAVFESLLQLDLPALDRETVLSTMVRLADGAGRPPALRGAALGLAYALEALGDDGTARARVMAVLRAMPPRDALGDFLYGLFACARSLATADDAIARALHATLAAIGTEDFLAALPALRGAMGWLPPRERGAVAAHAARLLGDEAPGASNGNGNGTTTGIGTSAGTGPRGTGVVSPWLLTSGRSAALLNARRIEARALAAARELGL
ncbi:DUF5682 family protein [Roseateles sp. L2-2]|uniref:DUF5682 family protein n=1 Tax=Roseateles sp. L2-2 TaxID=3422597 RepID=UPI003D35B73B